MVAIGDATARRVLSNSSPRQPPFLPRVLSLMGGTVSLAGGECWQPFFGRSFEHIQKAHGHGAVPRRYAASAGFKVLMLRTQLKNSFYPI